MKLFKIVLALCSLVFIQDNNFKFAVYSGAPVVQDGTGSRGSSWGDIDSDGDLDLFVSNRGNQNNLFYINKTQDPSRPVLELLKNQSIVLDGGDSQGSAFADYDGDGDLDLYVANRRNQKNFLYQYINGVFEKVLTGDIVNDTLSSTSISWVDVNNDNYLDLFVASRNNQPNALYVNGKNGSFEKIKVGSIVQDLEDTRASAWGDLDNDGDQDLYVGNADMTNSIYINEGNLKFSKLTSGIQMETDYTYGVSIQDINNDGFADLFTANLFGQNVLQINNGDLSFTKIKEGGIVKDIGNSKGIVWQDFDNDGDLDLFISNGTPGSVDDHYLYENNGAEGFNKIDNSIITKHGGLAAGSSSADINNDGKMDLLVTNWVDNSNNKLFFNLSGANANNWVQVALKGDKSPNPPYGAKVAVHYRDKGSKKVFYQFLASQSGYASQSSPILHFGIGTATTIDSIKVIWPSGNVQLEENIRLNQKQVIKEAI